MNRRTLLTALLSLALLLHGGCTWVESQINPDDGGPDPMYYLALASIVYNSDVCRRHPSPGESSAMLSGSPAGLASVRGQLLTAAGTPVVSAVILVDDATATDNVYYSTYSSINHDGTFILSGIPTGSGYRLSAEPLHSTYSNRIDYHIDCFKTPATFTAGYYLSDGATITTSRPSAGTFDLTSAGEMKNLGTIRILE